MTTAPTQNTGSTPNDFDRLLSAATRVRILGINQSPRQAHLLTIDALLSTIERLVAIWDGLPTTHPSDTGDMVAAARHRRLPVTVVWPPGTTRAQTRAPTAEQGMDQEIGRNINEGTGTVTGEDADQRITVSPRRIRAAGVVTVSGEVDLVTAPALRAGGHRGLPAPRRRGGSHRLE
jgi:hypothetical protein